MVGAKIRSRRQKGLFTPVPNPRQQADIIASVAVHLRIGQFPDCRPTWCWRLGDLEKDSNHRVDVGA